MTIFGVLWILLVLFVFIFGKINHVIFLTFLSMIIQSSNVISGNINIGPQVITNLLFIIWYFIKYNKIVISKKLSPINKGLFMFILIVILSSCINNVLQFNILKIFQLIIYIFVCIIMSKLHDNINREHIHKLIVRITVIVLIFGIIQFLMTSNIIPKITIIKILFYNDNADNVYFNHNNYYRLTSIFMEPSYCVSFLVPIFYYFLSLWKIEKNHVILIITILVEIILTKSTSGYIAFVVVGIIFLLYSDNKNVKKIVIPIACLTLIVLFEFQYDLLDSVIFSKNESGSFLVRNQWNERALEAYRSHPIIGNGYNRYRASSVIISLLSNLGILGCLTYVMINLLVCYPIFIKRKNNAYNSGVRFAVLSVFIVQIIAIPDIDLCTYWLIMYFFALTFNLTEID